MVEKLHVGIFKIKINRNLIFDIKKLNVYICKKKDMRKLASIQSIREILPIEGADRIELAMINDWPVVIAKDVGHKVDDKIVYCEIDSFLPIEPEFEFLRKSSYKKMDDIEGFRLKTRRLKGVYSQGLILPLSVLESITNGKIVEEDDKLVLHY